MDCIQKYQIGLLHLTTCQTVQFHDLSAKTVCEIMEKAFDVGIITRGGGGDFPRNVMVSPLSGVEAGEYFDVMPYALAVSDYLLGIIKTVKMPRKLKVCFSNSPANETHATFRDLGFVAKPEGTFDVYSAGGLGNHPRMGLKVAEQISPSEVLYYVKAMVDTFVAHGNYESRAKARTRYMQETLGTEGYKQAYLEKLKLAKAGEDLSLRLTLGEVTKNGTSVDPAVEGTDTQGEKQGCQKRVIPQKQEGLYAVAYHPIGGVPQASKFAEIYETTAQIL